MRKREGQVIAEIPMTVTSLSTLPRRADIQLVAEKLPRTDDGETEEVALDGLLLDPGTQSRMIAMPVPTGGCWQVSLELRDCALDRVVCSSALPLMLEYRPLRVAVISVT